MTYRMQRFFGSLKLKILSSFAEKEEDEEGVCIVHVCAVAIGVEWHALFIVIIAWCLGYLVARVCILTQCVCVCVCECVFVM